MMKAALKIAKFVSPIIVRANKNHVNNNNISQQLITRMATPYYTTTTTSRSSCTLASSSSGNPCLDLYYLQGDGKKGMRAASSPSHIYLKQLLPLAWSHNPLTTLQLICNLQDDTNRTGKGDEELFYTALFWLHQNHPKTLACNIEAITADYGVGSLMDFVEFLYRLLLVESDHNQQNEAAKLGLSLGRREKTIAIANKAIERYERDPHFQLFHDRLSDVFADYLKSDIEKLNKINQEKEKKQQQQQKSSVDHKTDEDVNIVEFSQAVHYLPYTGYRAGTLLCESVARKVFPREEGYQGLEEADYTNRVRSRLRKEVLLPGRKMDGYHSVAYKCEVKQYLEDVKAGRREIKIDTESANFFPHKILDYVNDPDVGDEAELLWKAMVEDMSNKGKWKNCLAVCDVSESMSIHVLAQDVAVALTIMLSQLNDEESCWKGKVIPFALYPDRLVQIRGNDLKSKCAFLRGMSTECDEHACFTRVLDLILQEAVSSKLKPEHMIKKVLVFSHSGPASWNSHQNQEMQAKFEEKGYAMPHIVVWKMGGCKSIVEGSQFSRLTGFCGFTIDFLKSLLENEGDVGPEHAMEAAISGKQYQNLVVVD